MSETLPEGCEDLIFPDFTPKKSLGKFWTDTAKRAGVVLWEKPFCNMRSTLATELIAIFPAHIVNAIMGHTEEVAKIHYRQVLPSDYQKLADFQTDKKSVGNSVGKHAGIGLKGVESGNLHGAGVPAINQYVASTYNDIQRLYESKFSTQVGGEKLHSYSLNFLIYRYEFISHLHQHFESDVRLLNRRQGFRLSLVSE
ncbi:MAG: hypothetical protein FWE67_14145 [Planctomycetaceae bacterium]|nr:hypothetical protein [Planctomycetaceae bacterium]